MPAPQLNATDLRNVVRKTPLVSIDLVIRDTSNKILLGLRTNEPAKGSYFVPGGRILKDERLNDAFARILKAETSFLIPIAEAHFIGVYEHFYEVNFFNEPGFGTHYVVLAYGLQIGSTSKLRADAQHSEYVWWEEPKILTSEKVHENTKAYFR